MNNMNFNLGKKVTSSKEDSSLVKPEEKEDEEMDYEEDYSNDTSSTSNNNKDDGRKKMVKMMMIFMIVVVVFIVIVLIGSMLIKRTYSYEGIEKVLQTSAEKYFADNKEQLPTEEDQIVEIDVANLVAGEYMKDLSEYTEKGKSCSSATVQVEKVGNDYLYTPFLSCGSDYQTKFLYQEVVQDKNIVDTGYGLYSQNGIYAYRGEEVNNYVKLDNSLWRIVKITADNEIELIRSESVTLQGPWDDRFNGAEGYTSGLNNYQASRVKENLQNIYKGKTDEETPILSSNDKKKLVAFNLCTGKRDANTEGTDGTIECNEVTQNVKIGLLPLYDYLNASVDATCKNVASKTCQNYNYLNIKKNWWTATANASNTSQSYQITTGGNVDTIVDCMYAEIRPVVYLNSKVLFKTGKGTESKPYTVR